MTNCWQDFFADPMMTFACLADTPYEVVGALPHLGASKTESTVSGISSGGFMAVQMHVIYSDMFKGAGVVAGGPFYCAQDNVLIAQSSCMKTPALISDIELETITESTWLTTHTIANPSNLKH